MWGDVSKISERAIIYREIFDMMYLEKGGNVTKRRINVLQVEARNSKDTKTYVNPEEPLQLIICL